MARFNLADYETVAERLVKFWADYPNGRIHTEVVNDLSHQNNEQFVVRAYVYKDLNDEHAWATGLAEEHFGIRGPNETSPIENCETSAIGRALANAGYATKSDKRASREEMEKVERGRVTPSETIAAIKENKAQALQQQAAAAAPAKPAKVSIEGDPRWNMIQAGHKANPGNAFLKSIYDAGIKYGKLSTKQLDNGCTAADKLLGAGPRGDGIKTITESFPGAVYEGHSTEPFE